MRRRLPTLTPRQYERVALVALVGLGLIALTGAAVRLTGSGLGCPNWPKCGDSFVAPLETHAWIEYGNRLASALVGAVCIGAALLAFRRRPFRRDLAWIGGLYIVAILAQGVLGGLTVMFELKWGFVMGHFLLSFTLLIIGVALYWRASHEPSPRATEDRRLVLATRALFPIGVLAIVAGTLTTATGPHAGAANSGEGAVVARLDVMGLNEIIHWHGRTGTLLGLSALAVWFLARRWGGGPVLRKALTVLCLCVAAQGVVGFAQYELELPTELVWLHIVIATGAWLSLLFSVAAAGRLSPAVERTSSPAPALPKTG